MIIKSGRLLRVYEELRSYVVGERYTFSHPPGLDLFLKAGFLRWAEAQNNQVGPKPLERATSKTPEGCQQGTEKEITLVLANMILAERTGSVSV